MKVKVLVVPMFFWLFLWVILCLYLAVNVKASELSGQTNKNVNDLLKVLDAIKNNQDISAGIEFADIRDKYKIPASVQILSPSEGKDIIVFVYSAKDFKYSTSTIIPKSEMIKHITSSKNLERVFLLYYFEPFVLDLSSTSGHYYALAVTNNEQLKLIENTKKLQTLSISYPIYIKSADKVIVVKKLN